MGMFTPCLSKAWIIQPESFHLQEHLACSPTLWLMKSLAISNLPLISRTLCSIQHSRRCSLCYLGGERTNSQAPTYCLFAQTLLVLSVLIQVIQAGSTKKNIRRAGGTEERKMEQEEFHTGARPETSMAQEQVWGSWAKVAICGVLHPAVTGQHWASIMLSRFLLKPAQGIKRVSTWMRADPQDVS